MNKFVIDTQAMVKHLVGESQVISPAVDKILKDADQGLNVIVVPAVVAFEVAYLNEKERIPIGVDRLRALIDGAINYVEEPISFEIVESAFSIPDIPELHDRLIAGVARYLEAPILTNDPAILKSQYVQCV